jgi:hypothetical protein
MVNQRSALRLVGYSVAMISMAGLPACRSADGTRPWLFGRPPADSTNTVLRPAYPWPETKPLFVSGYAGATYESRAPIRPMYARPAPAPMPAPVTGPSTTVEEGSFSPN